MNKKNKSKNFIENYAEPVAIFFIIIGLIIFSITIYKIIKSGDLNVGIIDLKKSADFGSFVGGFIGSIWSLIGIILFYSSLQLQRTELRLQREEIKKQREEFILQRVEMEQQTDVFNQQKFETSFYNLFAIYKNIIYLSAFNEEIREASIDLRNLIETDILDLLKSDFDKQMNDKKNNYLKQILIIDLFSIQNHYTLLEGYDLFILLVEMINKSNIKNSIFIKIIISLMSEMFIFIVFYISFNDAYNFKLLNNLHFYENIYLKVSNNPLFLKSMFPNFKYNKFLTDIEEHVSLAEEFNNYRRNSNKYYDENKNETIN